jgi:hypothetical protein
LKAYQQASALALAESPSNRATFYRNLDDPDSGIRYWAIVGLYNIQEQAKLDLAVIKHCLNDDSHHVRVMAAWILYRAGDQARAQACWNDLLRNSSYASLKIFNIIDWIGEGSAPYTEAMKACTFSHGGYVARMQEYMGVKSNAGKKPRKKKK